MFVVTTWIYPIPLASFGFMITTLICSIGGLIFDSFLTPYIFRENPEQR